MAPAPAHTPTVKTIKKYAPGTRQSMFDRAARCGLRIRTVPNDYGRNSYEIACDGFKDIYRGRAECEAFIDGFENGQRARTSRTS